MGVGRGLVFIIPQFRKLLGVLLSPLRRNAETSWGGDWHQFSFYPWPIFHYSWCEEDLKEGKESKATEDDVTIFLICFCQKILCQPNIICDSWPRSRSWFDRVTSRSKEAWRTSSNTGPGTSIYSDIYRFLCHCRYASYFPRVSLLSKFGIWSLCSPVRLPHVAITTLSQSLRLALCVHFKDFRTASRGFFQPTV